MDILTPTLPFIQNLQTVKWLVGPMQFFSLLGSEGFFLLLLPLVYWGIDRKIGARLGLLLLFSAVINDLFKVAVAWPRPFWSEGILKLTAESSFGFPSGHSQAAIIVWPLLALQTTQKRRFLVWALVLAACIGFSRIYLGAHYPADVAGGFVIGTAILLGFLRWGERLIARLKTRPLCLQLALAIILTLGAFLLFRLALASHPFEADYSLHAQTLGAAQNGALMFSRCGAFLGLCVGLILAQKISFQAAAPLSHRVWRLFVGFAGVALFYFGLKILAGQNDAPELRFVRYFATTFWVTCGALCVFEKLKLSGTQQLSPNKI